MTDSTSDEEAVFVHDPEAFALTHDTNPSGIPSVVITFDPDADTQARYRIPLEAVEISRSTDRMARRKRRWLVIRTHEKGATRAALLPVQGVPSGVVPEPRIDGSSTSVHAVRPSRGSAVIPTCRSRTEAAQPTRGSVVTFCAVTMCARSELGVWQGRLSLAGRVDRWTDHRHVSQPRVLPITCSKANCYGIPRGPNAFPAPTGRTTNPSGRRSCGRRSSC